ncbi:HNH endonuclease signature motif containing protein [Mycobacterium riyadhense]|uniref:HNH endonuclease signature motif containing protein n=1 Tax=Mycobacterium riyadhense TaxID=486698 RepID=UPI00195DDDA1|nr:HNH endonuclease signature motif containing protein [Mycobacterium riyadhense]
MSSSTREDIVEVFDALDAELDRLCGLAFDVLTTPERLRALERLERVARRLPVPGHALINQLAAQASEEELGGTLGSALADRLRLTQKEANRRIAEAEELGERRALTGEPLPPQLSATAAAQRAGQIGAGHVREIRTFFKKLPAAVDLFTREAAEADLADKASKYRPDQLSKYAGVLLDCLNPDGTYTDDDRARRRGITIGNQEFDGMSRLSGLITPELRATLEAALAKLAAPGMCNPLDDTPCVDGEATEEAVRRDTRSQSQRNHDGLLAGLRGLLASGELGQHNGLPASIIATTTLQELEAAAGRGLTGGGTILPISDVIRLGRHANHYLAVFDKGKAVALYHTKRLASPGQRIVLYAKDRGCSAPGCDVAGYYSEVHHLTPYAQCRTTDVNDLTFACGGHHPLAEKGWTTRKNARGDTEWIPPPHLDHGQPRTNSFHHPEKLLYDGDDEDPA